MHTVLYLQTNGFDTKHNQPLKQRLRESSFGSLLTHNNGAQLAMISNQHYLFGAEDERDKDLGFGSLSGLIDENLTETEVDETGVACSYASTTDDICVLYKMNKEVYQE